MGGHQSKYALRSRHFASRGFHAYAYQKPTRIEAPKVRGSRKVPAAANTGVTLDMFA
jgi:hypothetical protein